MATKNDAPETVTLISPDGEHSIDVPVTDAVEQVNLRAQGWATKDDRAETAKADKVLAAEQKKQADEQAAAESQAQAGAK